MTRLTVERVFSDPPLSGSLPMQLRITADARWVLYLANPPEARERLDLYGYDVAAGATRRLVDAARLEGAGELTDAEQAERERRRQFSGGVTSYAVSADGARVAFLVDGRIHLLNLAAATTRTITAAGARQTDLRFSATGRWLSYVRDGELFTYDLREGREIRRTWDAGATVSNGVAEFIAQEEMHRFDGHWWSPDDNWLVFARVDTHAIPATQRYELRRDGLAAVEQRYPYAGSHNAQVTLHAVDLASNAVLPIAWADEPDDYLARAGFGGGAFTVQVQNRAQTRLALKSIALGSDSAPAVLVEERHPTWLNLHDNLSFLPDRGGFLWTSERDGSAALYHYPTGASPVRLTRGGRVNRVVRADRTQVFFLGWVDAPTEQHLFRVRLDAPGVVERVTQAPGWHDVAVEPGGRWYVDRHASVSTPPHIDLVRLDGSADAQPIAANALDLNHSYAPFVRSHSTPTFGHIAAVDGQRLWYRLTLPADFRAGARYPVIVHVYGGPGVQRVVNDWAPLTLQLLVQAGYGVFELDNRGGGNREKSFEDPIYRRLGSVEVDDQLAGAQFLRSLPWVDRDRIGIFGHSYGGYMALLCLARGRGTFRAGVSSAPVTDWRLYDTHYTERYLGTPQDAADAYATSAVFAHLDGLQGDLLLMHGMADDNVLFDHSARLMLDLQRRCVPFELMLYPGAKHALQERSVAIHRFETILRFFARTLR